MLKIRCPETCIDGLVRVDIMLSNDENKIIVNEFESLEANFYITKFAIEEESEVKIFLTQFKATKDDNTINRYILHLSTSVLDDCLADFFSHR